MAKQGEIEQEEERGEAQEGAGYGCSCGFKTLGRKEFSRHLIEAGHRDGKGTHKSIGRVNMQTGEVVMGPWVERTKEQQERSTIGQKKKEGSGKTFQQAAAVQDATSLRVVPRIYTIPFTPIMNMGREAAVREWGWPSDMAFEDFLDTVIYHMFNDRNITLIGYIVNDKVEGGNNGGH